MNILIVGVSGFIGRACYQALMLEGHLVSGCSRTSVANMRWSPLDFEQSDIAWQKQLEDIELVINAAGCLQQSDQDRFSIVHDLGPKRLFAICGELGIKVIQISAIGAEQVEPSTEFLRSKRQADQFLLQQPHANVVLYPGVVLGERGATTQQLSLLARQVCMPMVFKPKTILPLVSLAQLLKVVSGLVNTWPSHAQALTVVAKPETAEQLLLALKKWQGSRWGCFMYVPQWFTKGVLMLFPKLQSYGNPPIIN
jgi:nucleoside-diphosphate-sugar epimerase